MVFCFPTWTKRENKPFWATSLQNHAETPSSDLLDDTSNPLKSQLTILVKTYFVTAFSNYIVMCSYESDYTSSASVNEML